MSKKSIFIIFLTTALLGSGAVMAYSYDSGAGWGNKEYAQNGNVRSRSEIIREVKNRYDAEILRISYDKKREVYKVRVLMPNGKVRNLTISARQ